MRLKYDNSKVVFSPNENDIINSLRELTENKISFFLLEKSQKEFIQCANSKDGKIIEYHNNNTNKHLKYYFNQSNQGVVIQNILSFINNNEVNETDIAWESFVLTENKSIIKIISRFSLFLGGILLIIFIWDFKFNDSSSHLFVGNKSLYFLTIVFGFIAIGFISDFYSWNKLRNYEKANAISSIALAIFLIIMSIVTYLGYGNFAK